MTKEKPYCLKCEGQKVESYSADLCEKHYNEQELTNKTMEKTFTCPHCKEDNDKIGNWESGNSFYKYHIETEDYDKYDYDSLGESGFFCLDCDKDITEEELEEQGIEI